MESFNIDRVKFGENGLIPAITQDAFTNRVLMQAYMNKDALELTLSTKKAHYFSRSRNKLWLKGETSGYFQRVTSIFTDCDGDSILLKVIQTGVACHTGNVSCFYEQIAEFDDIPDIGIINDDAQTIKDRIKNPIEGSYTNYLFTKGKEKICKKVGEESAELIIAAMKGDKNEIHEECADLIYHVLALLENMDTDFTQVLKVLRNRSLKERSRNY